MRNGELLKLSVDAGYDVMITADQGIEHEDNIAKQKIALITLTSPRWPDVKKHIPQIRRALADAKKGRATTVEVTTQKKTKTQGDNREGMGQNNSGPGHPSGTTEGIRQITGQEARRPANDMGKVDESAGQVVPQTADNNLPQF